MDWVVFSLVLFNLFNLIGKREEGRERVGEVGDEAGDGVHKIW